MTPSPDDAPEREEAREADYLALRERMAPEVPPSMLAHIDRVVAVSERLARRFDLDVPRVMLTSQAHDLLRAVPEPELLAKAEARGLKILTIEREQPVLLHGPLGALELAERFRIRDQRVLDAVRYHTTGHPEYDSEAWAFFIADKIEPAKLARWAELQRVIDASERSLEEGALAYLELQAERAASEGWPVHPLAEETLRFLDVRVRAP